jgi:hypothetical protein
VGPNQYTATSLVECDREPIEEPVLTEDAGHIARQFGKADHCSVADRPDPNCQPAISSHLFVTGCPAEGVGRGLSQVQSQHRRNLQVKESVVGAGVNQRQESG